jgi:16S rRNA (uracil1498-N3)-methyltransferase
MARRRFFVDEIHNHHAQLIGDDARHLSQVLRVEAGQKYELSDNRDVYLAEVEIARKERVVFRTLEKLPPEEPGVRVALYAALIKFERFEWILEKATELGVASITPIETVRSERGLEKAAPKRLTRWRRIVLESSQQSRRLRLPEVAEPVGFREALKGEADRRLFLDEERTGIGIATAVGHYSSYALMLGPEGGWTDAEREQAISAGWTAISLGPQILRAETAAVAALAVINALALSDPADPSDTEPRPA